VTLDIIVTTVTADAIVAFAIPFAALMMPSLLMTSRYLKNDLTDFHENWYGLCAIAAQSKIALF
jgi:hypothetical protein